MRGRRSRVTARGLLVLVGVVLLLFAAAAPALADHEVEFKITGFGDQDCRTGSGRLSSSSAGPFSVEVCVTLNGEPLPSHVMTAKVTHGDGTTQEIPFTTDEQGMAKVLIDRSPKRPPRTPPELQDIVAKAMAVSSVCERLIATWLPPTW